MDSISTNTQPPALQRTSNLGFRTVVRLSPRLAIAVTVLALVFPASATGPVKASDLHPVKTFRHWIEVGQASWYGLKFQGRKTATGETYDMNLMTCAHRSLPLGTWIKVTNLSNRKSVFVRVNDRGPALDDRIVDLSYAAAQAVGVRGLSKVRLDRIRSSDPELAKSLMAQVQLPMIPGVLPR